MDNKKLTQQQILNESYEWNWALSTVAWPWGNWFETDINNTVWGIPKVSLDKSLFHWIWTYNIPQKIWHIHENDIHIDNNDLSTKCVSNLGQMEINSWATIWDTAELISRRHPRYQPNRWHYFATAWYIPTPTA